MRVDQRQDHSWRTEISDVNSEPASLHQGDLIQPRNLSCSVPALGFSPRDGLRRTPNKTHPRATETVRIISPIMHRTMHADPGDDLRRNARFPVATRVLVNAMESSAVRRLICITGFGAGDSRGRGGYLHLAGWRC
jgi:hypothetical protein